MELKRESASKALRQIREKGYGEKYRGRDLYLVGIRIDEEKRNLAEFEMERLR